MRKVSFRLLVIAVAILMISSAISSCRHEKRADSNDSILLLPKMELNASDSSEVRHLADSYMEYLKSGNFETALSMLYYYDGKQVLRLPQTLEQQQLALYKRFPVINYTLDGIIFNRETDCQVKYTIEFFEKPEGDLRPNTTSIFLKPIRLDGKWYLTVYDSATHKGEPSEIVN